MENIDKGCLAIIIIPFIVTLIGFYNFLYFITIGYGFSLSFINVNADTVSVLVIILENKNIYFEVNP